MLNIRLAAVVLVAAAGIGPSAARAQDGGEAHDTQCMLMASALSTDEDKEMQEVGVVATAFFMGKLYGRNPNYDMVVAAKPWLTTLNEARMKVLLTECGEEMSRRGAQAEAAGKAIEKLEK